MIFDSMLLNKISYSIVSPFDLSSSNESERNLTPASAGSLIADEVMHADFESCVVCFFNAASYNQLSEFLKSVYEVFHLEKINNVRLACDYMEEFESLKRLSNPDIVSTKFKEVRVNSLLYSGNGFNDVIALDSYESDLTVDADEEINSMVGFVESMSNSTNDSISLVKDRLLVPSNKVRLSGGVSSMADSIIKFSEELPQNTPYTVGLCFAGSIAAVSYLDSMIVG